jgi:hypothetical protein
MDGAGKIDHAVHEIADCGLFVPLHREIQYLLARRNSSQPSKPNASGLQSIELDRDISFIVKERPAFER